MNLPTAVLQDERTGARARVLTGFGFNCYQWQIPCGDKLIEVLYAAEDFHTGQARASGSGIPLLFPFPGRLAGHVFSWQEKTYQLSPGDGHGNAIHGFVLNRPWRVLQLTDSKVIGQFQASVDDPTLLEQWPADFRLTASYELHGHRLVSQILVENPDSKPLPCGLGTHPYFHLPLGGVRSEECVVKLPIREQWELSGMLPTGRRHEVADAGQFQAGRPFDQLTLDSVFTGLVFHGSQCVASIIEPAAGVELSITFNDVFRECVVYTPPHRRAICIEPYTCVPNAGALLQRGIDSGLRVLQPGETLQAEIAMDLRIHGK